MVPLSATDRGGNLGFQMTDYKITKLQNQGFNATTNAVITKFAIATGNKNFHPKAINWS